MVYQPIGAGLKKYRYSGAERRKIGIGVITNSQLWEVMGVPQPKFSRSRTKGIVGEIRFFDAYGLIAR